MEQNNDTFHRLIEAAITFSREGAEHAHACDDFEEAMRLLSTKEARLELRISFNPVPAVIGELIRDCDGELIGHLFQHQARAAIVN